MVTQCVDSSGMVQDTSLPGAKDESMSSSLLEKTDLVVEKRSNSRKSGVKKHQCTECGKSFDKAYRLNRHTKIHTNEKAFKCEICGKSFIQGDYMRIHMKTHEKPSELCSICGQTFKQKRCLDIHMLTHKDEWPFVCKICDSKHRQKSDLQKHVRSHTDERPYICEVCGKGFKRSTTLTDHKRLHTEERPFECKYCGRCFNQSGNMESHVKSVHKGQTKATGSWSVKLVEKKNKLKKKSISSLKKKSGKVQTTKSCQSTRRTRAHENLLSKFSSSRQIPYSSEKPWKQQLQAIDGSLEHRRGNSGETKSDSDNDPRSGSLRSAMTVDNTKNMKTKAIEKNSETDCATESSNNSPGNIDHDSGYSCDIVNSDDLNKEDLQKTQSPQKNPNGGVRNSQVRKDVQIHKGSFNQTDLIRKNQKKRKKNRTSSEKVGIAISDSKNNQISSGKPRSSKRTEEKSTRSKPCENKKSLEKDETRNEYKTSAEKYVTASPRKLRKSLSPGRCARHIPYTRKVAAIRDGEINSPGESCPVYSPEDKIKNEYPKSENVILSFQGKTDRTYVNSQILNGFEVVEHEDVSTIASREQNNSVRAESQCTGSVPALQYSNQLGSSPSQDSDLSSTEMVVVHVYVNTTSPRSNNRTELLSPLALDKSHVSEGVRCTSTSAISPQVGQDNKEVLSADVVSRSAVCPSNQIPKHSEQTSASSRLQSSDKQDLGLQRTVAVKTEVANSPIVSDSVDFSRTLDSGPGAVHKMLIRQNVNSNFCSSPPKKRFKMSYLNSVNM